MPTCGAVTDRNGWRELVSAPSTLRYVKAAVRRSDIPGRWRWDVTSEVLLRLCRVSPRWDHRLSSWKTWVFLHARFAVRDYCREVGFSIVRTPNYAARRRAPSIRPASLDTPLLDTERLTYADLLCAEDGRFARAEDADRVRALLCHLRSRDRRVMEAYYGIGRQPVNLDGIARELRVCESRASQIHAAALKRLRAIAEAC